MSHKQIVLSDGKLLASGSDDNTVKFWDIQTGGVIKTFHGHTHWVVSVSISADCTRIVSGSWDEKVRQSTPCVCPKRTATWLPAIASKMMISPFPNPIAMVLFQYEKAHGTLSNETVWEHVPHSDLGPLTTLGAFNDSAV